MGLLDVTIWQMCDTFFFQAGKNRMNTAEKKLTKFALACLFMFTFSGVMSLIAVKYDNMLLRIWKEGLIIALFCVSLAMLIFRREVPLKKITVFFILFLPFIAIYFLLSININPLLVAYQIKNDVVPFLFVFSLFLFLRTDEGKINFYHKLIRLIIITALINSFFIYIESFFSDVFMSYLNIEDLNNEGGKSGVRLDNSLWGLRAMGTMTSFINSGTLTFFGIVCVLESRQFKFTTKVLFLSILTSAMILTTYKSTMIALVFYFATKFVYSVFKRVKGAKLIYPISGFLIFCLLAFTFNSMSIYNLLSTGAYKEVAYNSIYNRVIQHEDIINEMESKNGFYTGVGVGTNGTMGPDQKLKVSSKPLDSTYIYIMSNYGFIGVIIYILVLMSVFIYLSTFNRRFDNIALVMVFYTFSIEFFINNIFANFPCNIIFYSAVFMNMTLKKNGPGNIVLPQNRQSPARQNFVAND